MSCNHACRHANHHEQREAGSEGRVVGRSKKTRNHEREQETEDIVGNGADDNRGPTANQFSTGFGSSSSAKRTRRARLYLNACRQCLLLVYRTVPVTAGQVENGLKHVQRGTLRPTALSRSRLPSYHRGVVATGAIGRAIAPQPRSNQTGAKPGCSLNLASTGVLSTPSSNRCGGRTHPE